MVLWLDVLRVSAFCFQFTFASFFFAGTSYAKQYSSWGALFDRNLLLTRDEGIDLPSFPPSRDLALGEIDWDDNDNDDDDEEMSMLFSKELNEDLYVYA